MEKELGKVTCFITRKVDDQLELLLLQHPSAGIQLPAGTVEIDEDYLEAALREANEETGLKEFIACHLIGSQELNLVGQYMIYEPAKVYAKPDKSSFQWAEIRRGITVFHERNCGNFIQITYKEGDKFPDPNYISYQITGWVEESNVASKIVRKFYHLESNSRLNEWEIETDHQIFKLFWSPIDQLPQIVSPQNEWVDIFLRKVLLNMAVDFRYRHGAHQEDGCCASSS